MNDNDKSSVAIIAGGFGTRLKDINGDLPKPMTAINGVPLLEHQIKLCKDHGFTSIVLILHYGSEKIRSYFGNGENWGLVIRYVIEDQPMGTGGALRFCLDLMRPTFLVLYGDTYLDVHLSKFWSQHQNNKADATLFIHPNDHPYDSDLVEVDDFGAVISIHKNTKNDFYVCRNLVNAALYVCSRDALKTIIPPSQKLDLARDVFPSMLKMGMKISSYKSFEYIKDMGTPERLKKVSDDLTRGVPKKLSLNSPRSAVFIDRDGTINEEVGHIKSPDQLKLINGSATAIKNLNQHGFLSLCVTNQPVLARGEASWTDLNKIHSRLDLLLGQQSAYLDDIYVCPHHPESGFTGEVAALKIKCDCRKPLTGLIEKAVTNLNISLNKSWFIGDTTSDILTGENSGLKTILVKTGYAGNDYKYEATPDFISENLSDAVNFITTGYQKVCDKLEPLITNHKSSRIILIGGPSQSGKSTTASVMKILFQELNIKVHIIPIDGWLKPKGNRLEGSGVLSRYNVDQLVKVLSEISLSTEIKELLIPRFDRKTQKIRPPLSIRINPDDLLIVEGVPALMDDRLVNLAKLKFYVDVSESKRITRLRNEYKWRGELEDTIINKIQSRELDEVQLAQLSSKKANYIINIENDYK